MKVFLSGIAGFIGSHLASRFVEAGQIVYGVDSLIGGTIDNLEGIEHTWHGADCSNFDTMLRVLDRFKPDVIYHTAASPHEGLSVFSPWIVNKNTYMSTVALVGAACAVGVGRIVFLSSMARYGDAGILSKRDTWKGFEEDADSPCPIDPYGVAKVASEQVLKILCDEHGIEYVIPVPHNVYGPKQKVDPYRNVAAIMINRLLQGKPPIIYGDGTQTRSFSYIDDCLPILVDMATNPKMKGEVINIGPDGDDVTINQLERILASMIRNDLPPIYMPERPCEVKRAFLNCSKAKSLGFKPETTLEDGLLKLVKWMCARGPKAFDYSLPIEIMGKRIPKTWSERLM